MFHGVTGILGLLLLCFWVRLRLLKKAEASGKKDQLSNPGLRQYGKPLTFSINAFEEASAPVKGLTPCPNVTTAP